MLGLSDAHNVWWAEYREAITSNCSPPPHEQLRKMHTDESFINNHYAYI